jgi:hypothetical protein
MRIAPALIGWVWVTSPLVWNERRLVGSSAIETPLVPSTEPMENPLSSRNSRTELTPTRLPARTVASLLAPKSEKMPVPRSRTWPAVIGWVCVTPPPDWMLKVLESVAPTSTPAVLEMLPIEKPLSSRITRELVGPVRRAAIVTASLLSAPN